MHAEVGRYPDVVFQVCLAVYLVGMSTFPCYLSVKGLCVINQAVFTENRGQQEADSVCHCANTINPATVAAYRLALVCVTSPYKASYLLH